MTGTCCATSQKSKSEVTIGLIGKYVELQDSISPF
jgi:CTP synthase (UTP-ammonia lyase)